MVPVCWESQLDQNSPHLRSCRRQAPKTGRGDKATATKERGFHKNFKTMKATQAVKGLLCR